MKIFIGILLLFIWVCCSCIIIQMRLKALSRKIMLNASKEENELRQIVYKQEQEILRLQDLLADSFANEVKNAQDREWRLFPVPLNAEPKKKLSLVSVMEQTADRFRPLARRLGVQIQTAVGNNDIYIYAAKKHIQIIFENILDNSLKYMNGRGMIAITLSEIDNQIFLVVKDNGAGLEKEELEKIFDRFYQGENHFAGMGLGLAMVKEIVEYYQGSIYAKSEYGKGLAIYISMKKEKIYENITKN